MEKSIETEMVEDMANKINEVFENNYLSMDEAMKESYKVLHYISSQLCNALCLYDVYDDPCPGGMMMAFEQYEMRKKHSASDVDNTLALMAIREICNNLLREKNLNNIPFYSFNDIFEVLNRVDSVDDDTDYFY
ncbi:hypothetical protein [Limosilactobacillus reuteri]|uniref:hypothetical protein n=1 Tax=Limosilactobacillus reuteri TaxID=1598 RepID=UPI001E3E0346|nr:hypothetical protein [Limosilactobacillus reuteri]MCC4482848.1 hypothetical protein [Limosilactobacillus reuteri]